MSLLKTIISRPGTNVCRVLHSGILSLVRAEESDLTMRQLGVLLICTTAKHPETVKSLAMRMQIAKPIITRAIDRLEELGLARRRSNPLDGRSVLIEATKTGHTLCGRFASLTKVGNSESIPAPAIACSATSVAFDSSTPLDRKFTVCTRTEEDVRAHETE
jgi:DNA-binding MarR family transcriptional regulator